MLLISKDQQVLIVGLHTWSEVCYLQVPCNVLFIFQSLCFCSHMMRHIEVNNVLVWLFCICIDK